MRFFLVEPKSCFHAGDFVARRGAIASICRRPASLDLGLAFRWPISRARRQMRGDRIKCLGLRTYRTSCINATDSICRRARMESQSVVKRGQWARVENAPKKAQLSKGRREARRSRPQGPAQIESVALCVWQCHLRNVSTLSNRTRSAEARFTGLTENCYTTNQSQESTCLTMLHNECCVGYWKAGLSAKKGIGDV